MIMPTEISTCPIWGPGHEARYFRDVHNRLIRVVDSPRSGGAYSIGYDVVADDIPRLSLDQKARLTTWVIDQRSQGDDQPRIIRDIIELTKFKPPLEVHNRVDRLLRFIGKQTTVVGTSYDIRSDDGSAYAWSESTSEGEIGYLIDYMVSKGWLDSRPRVTTVGFGEYEIPALVRVTVDGRSRIAEQLVNVDSSQAFVAMWFDDTMKAASDQGIEPAVEDAGYKPIRIDQKEHINKIDDEIVAEIRRSRFLVADFTHGKDGPRGGVYYEAGFAHGLGIPVIFTCREDAVNTLHFDTNHYNHIVWTTPEELRQKLKNRILAVIGEGPEPRED